LEKVLVIGLGMVGYEIVKKYFETGEYKISIASRSESGFFKGVLDKRLVDVTNEQKVQKVIQDINPDFVINTAAMTNVDFCEKEKELAYKANAISVGYIGKACKSTGSTLCHISTDYVFDGEDGNYVETDVINPINYYGFTKAEGERILNEMDYENKSIVRISTPYGFSPVKLNFFTWVLENLKYEKPINVITDQYNTSTNLNNLSEIMIKIQQNDLSGILHFGGSEKLSRYEFALKISEDYNLNSKLISPVKSSELNWVAKRPKDTSLISNLRGVQ